MLFRSCEQQFLSVFSEQVDWVDGDDPQYCAVLPITEPEATDLRRQQPSLTEGTLQSFAPSRRTLQHDYPKGGPESIRWGGRIWP